MKFFMPYFFLSGAKRLEKCESTYNEKMTRDEKKKSLIISLFLPFVRIMTTENSHVKFVSKVKNTILFPLGTLLTLCKQLNVIFL